MEEEGQQRVYHPELQALVRLVMFHVAAIVAVLSLVEVRASYLKAGVQVPVEEVLNATQQLQQQLIKTQKEEEQ